MAKIPKTIGEMQYFNFSFEPGKEISQRISLHSGAPLVSVITVCNQNSEFEFINQKYNCLKNQTFPYWEWIIVINEENPLIKKLAKSDKRIKIIVNQYESIAKAKLLAVKNSTTDLIFHFEENDLIDKTMIECGYFTMYFNQEADLAYSKMVEFGKKELLVNQNLNISDLKKKNIISPGVFIRKEVFLEIDDYENLSDDFPREWYSWLDLLGKKYIPLKMNFYGYWHRNFKNNKKRKRADKNIDSLLKEKIDKINEKSKIIQFNNDYNIDYSNTPINLNIKKSPIVPKDNKKRILFILPWTALGGAEIFDFNLIKGLKEKGYEISVITTQKCDYVLRQVVEQYVEEYFDVTSFLKKKDWASFIAYIIKSRRINIVFVSNSYYGYYALPWLKCQFKDIPFVDYIHSENWTLRNGGKPKDSNAVADYLDATYTCTDYLKKLMYKRMNRNVKNVKTVYIGTDTEFFNPKIELEKEEELKEKYKKNKVILLACRMVHAKRPIFAINVIKKMSEVRDDVRLAIVGDGVAMQDVKKYIVENDMQNLVECYGYQKDVRPFYKVADATIICSLQEGLALVAYESLSMGVPVVSADIGGQRELIGDDCGALIPVYQKLEEQYDFNYSDEELQKYADALLDVIDRVENTNIKEECRKKVIKRFSINKMINTLDNEFTKLIASGSQIDKKVLNNVELAERYLMVHSVLDSKEERKKK